MTTRILALTLAGIASLPGMAAGAHLSGMDLVAACASDEPVAQATCRGYVMAVADVLRQPRFREGPDARSCLPDRITIEDIRDRTVAFAKARRSATLSIGVQAIADALRSDFQCDLRLATP